VRIISGVTAASLASSVANVPLDDFVTVSLSTYTRSLKEIENKLISAINGNFTIVIYNINPIARKESALLAESILKKYAIDWDYYMVYNARRSQEKIIHDKIKNLDIKIANMDSILMVKKW
jgi:precorrin-3B C17-methyltransferase